MLPLKLSHGKHTIDSPDLGHKQKSGLTHQEEGRAERRLHPGAVGVAGRRMSIGGSFLRIKNDNPVTVKVSTQICQKMEILCWCCSETQRNNKYRLLLTFSAYNWSIPKKKRSIEKITHICYGLACVPLNTRRRNENSVQLPAFVTGWILNNAPATFTDSCRTLFLAPLHHA